MQGFVQSSCPLPLGCGARQIRLLHPIPLQIHEDLSILDAFSSAFCPSRWLLTEGFQGLERWRRDLYLLEI